MNFLNAIMMMQDGYKVRRKKWLKDDFIYLKEKTLLCDGEYPFLKMLDVSDYMAEDWIVYREDK